MSEERKVDMPDAIWAAFCIQTDGKRETWWHEDPDYIKGDKTKYTRAALAGVEEVTVEELEKILGSHIPFNYSGELSMNSVRDLMERYPNGLKIIGEKP